MAELTAHHIDTADVVVVGGGLAGLTAAAVAARARRRTVLLDAHRLGGRAAVDRRGGFVFNRGPRALYADGAGRAVLEDLDVSTTHGHAPQLRGAKGRRGGRLDLIPQGASSLLRTSLLPASEKLRFIRAFLAIGRIDVGRFTGVSADDAVRSLGLGPAGIELMTAMVRLSTYTAATDVLDGATALRQVQLGAGGGALYLDGGWQTLVDGLEQVATRHGAQVRSGQAVREVVDEDGSTLVVLADGGHIRAAQVVLAVGGPDAAAALLGGRPGGWPELGPPSSAACLELGLRRPPRTRLVLGIDEPTYLSTHCPTADLAPEGGAVVHLMRYLRHDDDLDSAAVRAELGSLARAAGVADDDIVEERFLARMVVTGAIPTAAAGGATGRVPVEVPGRPGVLLAGDWVGEEALLADAALASGALAGRLASERLTAGRRGSLAVT